MQVAFVRNDAAPVVAVQVWYHAGSKDEPRDRRGSAHMFEHLMFKGSEHVRSEAHAQYITGLGGYVNAATEEDATHYINTLPSDYLDFAVQLEAERMRNLLFRKDAIATEKENVKEEIRLRENSPLAVGFRRFLEIAFPKHPYAWDSGGRIKDLDVTTPDDLKKFYDTYYRPNNAMLVVVGKTTLDQVKASAEKWFGPIAKTADPPRPSKDAQDPAQTKKIREVVEPSQIGLTIIGWHIPPAKHADIYALQLASIILGVGESSRIKARLKVADPKTKRPLAIESGADALVREEPGIMVAFGAYLDPAQGDAVEAALFDEAAKLAASGPEANELRKAKNQVESGFTFSLENVQGLAEAVGKSWILTGDPKAFVKDIEAIEKVSAADVGRAVKTYMKPDLATVVVIPPKGR
ncbi:MAG TPA: pitrilysin family protein [Kofleriaceae bacterium]|nr:pitrilysin family protein [Kofleriaceae bacterium]